MIHSLCISCGRSGGEGVLPYVIQLSGDCWTRPIVALCADCADPARFSINQLADAIVAEFDRQLRPVTKGRNAQ
jgi:hypothetical protein